MKHIFYKRQFKETSLLAYHGSPNKFELFDLKKQKRTLEDYGLGISASFDYNFAKLYALSDDEYIRHSSSPKQIHNIGYIYYLKLNGKYFDMRESNSFNYIKNKAKKFIYKEEYNTWDNYDWENLDNQEIFDEVLFTHFGNESYSVLNDIGYSGIIVSKKEIRIFNPKDIKIIKVEEINET